MLRGGYRDTRLTTPTRLIIGAEDPSVRAELLGGAEGFADDLTLEVIDGASHFVVDDRPDAVIEHALKLFARA
jgi:pimeloyl-ACP methyl ester carboxylesterase